MLTEAVVVAGDGAGADVGIGADMGVADVGEMVDLDAGLQRRGLGLDEVADLAAVAERGARPQARIGTDGRVLADRGLHDVRERMDHRAVGDADAGADHHERLDGDVVAEPGIRGEIYGFRRDQRHPGEAAAAR